MLRQIIAFTVGLALLIAVAGTSRVVADALGWSVTTPAHACNSSGSAGGGC